jgi:hypothetical protein
LLFTQRFFLLTYCKVKILILVADRVETKVFGFVFSRKFREKFFCFFAKKAKEMLRKFLRKYFQIYYVCCKSKYNCPRQYKCVKEDKKMYEINLKKCASCLMKKSARNIIVSCMDRAVGVTSTVLQEGLSTIYRQVFEGIEIYKIGKSCIGKRAQRAYIMKVKLSLFSAVRCILLYSMDQKLLIFIYICVFASNGQQRAALKCYGILDPTKRK